jgi:hypothetical protein
MRALNRLRWPGLHIFLMNIVVLGAAHADKAIANQIEYGAVAHEVRPAENIAIPHESVDEEMVSGIAMLRKPVPEVVCKRLSGHVFFNGIVQSRSDDDANWENGVMHLADGGGGWVDCLRKFILAAHDQNLVAVLDQYSRCATYILEKRDEGAYWDYLPLPINPQTSVLNAERNERLFQFDQRTFRDPGGVFGCLDRAQEVTRLIVGGGTQAGSFSEKSSGLDGEDDGKDRNQRVGEFDFKKSPEPRYRAVYHSFLLVIAIGCFLWGDYLAGRARSIFCRRLGILMCGAGPVIVLFGWAML